MLFSLFYFIGFHYLLSLFLNAIIDLHHSSIFICIVFIILSCFENFSSIGHLIGACLYCKSNATWAAWWASDAGDTVSGQPSFHRPGRKSRWPDEQYSYDTLQGKHNQSRYTNILHATQYRLTCWSEHSSVYQAPLRRWGAILAGRNLTAHCITTLSNRRYTPRLGLFHEGELNWRFDTEHTSASD